MLSLVTSYVDGKALESIFPKKEKRSANQNTSGKPFIDILEHQDSGGMPSQSSGPKSLQGEDIDRPPGCFHPPTQHGYTQNNYDIDINISPQQGSSLSDPTKTTDNGSDGKRENALQFLRSLSPEQLEGLRDFIQLLLDNQNSTPNTQGAGNTATQGTQNTGNTGTQGTGDTTPQGYADREFLLQLLEFLINLLEEGEKDGSSPTQSAPSIDPGGISGGSSQRRISRKDIPKNKISHYNPNAFHGTKSAVVLAKGEKAKSVTIDGVKFRKHGSLDKGREVWVADKPGLEGNAKVDYTDGSIGNFNFSNDGINMAEGRPV